MTSTRSSALHVLVHEPNHTGHHIVYLSYLIAALRDLPVRTTILTSQAAVGSHEWSQFIAPICDSASIDASCRHPSQRSSFLNAAHRLLELRRGVARLRPDHVFVMYSDGIWQLAAMLSAFKVRLAPPSTPTEAWIWRGGFAYDNISLSNRIKQRLFLKLIGANIFDTLHIDDDLLYSYARSHISNPGLSLVCTPNPVLCGPLATPSDARARLGLPPDGRLICLLAMIDRRKGADLLLRAFAKAVAADRHRDLHLVLAGPVHEEIRNMLSTAPWSGMLADGALIVDDRFISPNDMLNYACACDLMTAPYPRHSGRSSLVIWAAAAGRPTLGTNRGCIAHVIRSERLGWTVDPTDTDAFADALIDSLEAAWSDDDVARARAYAKRHSLDAFRHSATERLRRRVESS